ncbi:hypothetical protein VL10_09450 [Leclercia adecarboxylata]|nr:hypothetical protein VL10_09450 [Leclercia adecarboxylata]KMN61787.1 hypothetical protein VK95_23120 [Leclercia sp. LK8]
MSWLENIGGALGVVLLLIMVIAWFARRAGGSPKSVRSSQHLSVIESRSLGQRERVAIIEVEDKWLVLGITSSQISCLTTLDRPVHVANDVPSVAQGEFQSALMKMLKQRKAGQAK